MAKRPRLDALSNWERERELMRGVQESRRDEYAWQAVRVAELGPEKAWLALEYAVAMESGGAVYADIGHHVRRLVDRNGPVDRKGHQYERDVWALDVIRIPEAGLALHGIQVKHWTAQKVGCHVIQQTMGGAILLQQKLRERLEVDAFTVHASIVCDAEVADSVHLDALPIRRVKLDALLAEARRRVDEFEHALPVRLAVTPAHADSLEPHTRREWQVDCQDWALRQWAADPRLTLLVSAAGGLGKTVAGACTAHVREMAIVWLTPHRALVRDAVLELRRCGRRVSLLGDDCPVPRAQGAAPDSPTGDALVVVAASAALKLQTVRHWLRDRSYCLVVDEAHRLLRGCAPTHAEERALDDLCDGATRREAARALQRSATGTLCLSATAGDLAISEEHTYSVPYYKGVDWGLVVPYRLTAVLVTRNDAAAWAEHLADNRTLLPAMVVCSSLDEIDEQVEACRRAGLVADTVHSRRGAPSHRAQVQDRLRDPVRALRDPLDVLVVFRCGIEGVDYPLLRSTVFRHMHGNPVDAQQAILRTSRCVLAVAKFAAHLLVPVVAPAASPGASAEELERALDRANSEHLAAVCDHLAAVEGHEDEPEARRRVAERLEVDVRTYRRAAGRGCPERQRVLRHLDLGDTEAAPGRCLGSIVVDTARRALLGRSLAQRMAEELCALWAGGNDEWKEKAVSVKAKATKKARNENQSAEEAELSAKRAKAAHLERYGVWSRQDRVCAWTLVSNMRSGQCQEVVAALRALASGTDGEAARALLRHIDEGLAAMQARAARRCYTPAETAEQLCALWAGGNDEWKEKAANVKTKATKKARNENQSAEEAELSAERAKAAHLERYGVWSRQDRACAWSLVSNMRRGQRQEVVAALRALASGTDGEAARALLRHIDEGLAAMQARAARRFYTPAEIAEQLCALWAGGDDAWREHASDVKKKAKRKARNENQSAEEAELSAERAKAAHLERYGVWSRQHRVYAWSLVSNMRSGQCQEVVAALRALASGTDGEAARALLRYIDTRE
jgi:superfamily II DNA or RNA helicase